MIAIAMVLYLFCMFCLMPRECEHCRTKHDLVWDEEDDEI